MLASILIGALLIACGVIMMLKHRSDLVESRQREQSPRDEEFSWRRFRRRMQASAMISVVGIAMILGQLPMAPLLAVFYWSGVVLVVLWMMLLAVADALSSYWHFRQEQRLNQTEQATLQARLRQLRGDEEDSSELESD